MAISRLNTALDGPRPGDDTILAPDFSFTSAWAIVVEFHLSL